MQTLIITAKDIKESKSYYSDYIGTENVADFDGHIHIEANLGCVRFTKLKAKGNLTELNREDIGEVEREAWDTYNKFYPPESVVIVIACPYNQKLLLAERVSNILCFYKFEKDTNLEAGGSHTPHANIHLSKMRRLDLFLKEEFEIEVDKQKFNDVLEFIKLWDINKPMGRVNWKQYDNVIKKLKETCPWIKDREERSG